MGEKKMFETERIHCLKLYPLTCYLPSEVGLSGTYFSHETHQPYKGKPTAIQS